MKIKVFGFKFNKAILPKAMKATDVFVHMEKTAGAKIGKTFRYGTHKIVIQDQGQDKDWWGGMVLKIRDSSAFTKLTEKEGKTILTAETLADNEKLVELTYFVAHPESGSGLLAHHYHGTSLTSFAIGCAKVFRSVQKEAAKAAIKEKTPNEKKAILKDFKGALELEQLCNDTDLKTLIKELKRISSFELKVATLETKETFLQGIVEKASHESIKLTFPPDADLDGLADDAASLAESESIAEIKVTGYDNLKNRLEFYNGKNPLVFHIFDYDDVMKGLVINLDDWASSIQNSEMIKKLVAVAAGKSTHKLLTSA